jgi:hypothetical protein
MAAAVGPFRRIVAISGGATLLIGLAVGLAPPAVAAPDPSGLYIVQLADVPASSYEGTVAGYAATRPQDGGKLDVNNADVGRYRSYLRTKHATAATKARSVQKVYDYTLSFNGFAARMPASSAAALAQSSGVVSVTKDELRTADTVSTPAFLGLTKPGGLWDQLGGPGRKGAGKDIVIGVIDSGIWPESASFAALTNPGPVTGFSGICQAGHDASSTTCNNKLIGARWYDAGLGGDAAILANNPGEFLSARDMDGHGSHTASTAGGNYNTPVVINGNSLGNASGMAPNARIAAYKALWHNATGASGSTADIVQAIDDATSDGVDVINFSVSGSRTTNVDPVEVAFLFAADAGIFVSASAGNDGPTSSTVAHNSPWLTTVAAGTHDRAFQATVTLGNGATYTGAGLGAAVPASPVVLSTNGALPGASATSARLCFSRTWDPAHPEGALDPAKVAGKIVVCDRGTNDRVDKSRAVQEAGGVGMILANTSPNSLNADFHFVPTVHVSDTDGAAIKAYVSGTANPTASFAAGHVVNGVEAPRVASFSSRGPALAVDGDLLKPDIMAPGVDVLAAVSPVTHEGRNFDFESGTSMAAPHIAGIAALIKQAHKNWGPMKIKSAMMTTASTLDNKGNPITTDTGGPAGAFDYGSGQVTPNSAVDPGLVYNSRFRDWIRYLCGSGQLAATGSSCTTYGSADPSNLNTPNIAIGQLAGSQTVTRTVTDVSPGNRKYRVAIESPPGVSVSVVPSVVKFDGDHRASYKVTFKRTTAAFGQYSFGALTWSDGKHSVRSQLAVRPVGTAAPGELAGTGVSGSTNYSVTAGFSGTLTSSVAGLVPATENDATLSSPSGGSFPTGSPVAGPHTAKFTVTVPAGTTLARFATFDSDVAAGTDLDLFVYQAGTASLVGSSAGASAQEQVDLPDPAAGSYDVYVDLFALAPGATQQLIKQFTWALGTTAAGNLTVSPASAPAQVGQPVALTVAWTGLTAGSRYLGRVSYSDGTSALGSTLVTVTA